MLTILKSLRNAVKDLNEWAAKPRVRLIPYHYSRRQLGISELSTHEYHKLIGIHTKNDSLLTYPKEYVSNEFYSITKYDPAFYLIKARCLRGFFLIQEDGIEQPNADVIAAWIITKSTSSYPNQCCVFFVDDAYYAGDILHYDYHHVRLLFKIKEDE